MSASDNMDIVEAEASGAMMSLGAPSSNNYGDETAVDNIPRTIYHPFPRAVNVLMPYRAAGSITVNMQTLQTNVAGKGFTVRLNSIEDLLPDALTITGNQSWTNDAITGTRNKPIMYEFWNDKYRYYHVLKTNYKVTFWCTPLDLEPELTYSDFKVSKLMAYKYMHGMQTPPLTNYGANTPVPHIYRKFHPDCSWKLIQPEFFTAFDRQGAPVNVNGSIDTWDQNVNTTQFEGEWFPGRIRHEVLEDEHEEVWTRFGDTPTQHEKMSFVIQNAPNNVINPNQDITVRYVIELVFEVQLKDLKTDYEYITASSLQTALSFGVQTN